MLKVVVSGFGLSLLMFVGATNIAFAQDNDVSAKQQVQEKLAKMQSLSAEFSQTVTADNGDTLQQLTGELAIQRPNKLRWRTDPPDDTLMIASGDTVWYYNPFVEQVTLYRQDDAAADSPMLLLLTGSEDQWQDYQVSATAEDQYLVEQIEGNNSLQLTFSDDVLQQIRLQQEQGDTIELTLQDVAVNPSLEADMFHFDIPDGVDVDDQR
ncbi:MAG: outer membrane lipoprotein chaperone LolA [Pseudomonadota bacterium]